MLLPHIITIPSSFNLSWYIKLSFLWLWKVCFPFSFIHHSLSWEKRAKNLKDAEARSVENILTFPPALPSRPPPLPPLPPHLWSPTPSPETLHIPETIKMIFFWFSLTRSMTWKDKTDYKRPLQIFSKSRQSTENEVLPSPLIFFFFYVLENFKVIKNNPADRFNLHFSC